VFVFQLSASEPTCWLNVSLPGNGVHESDWVEVNCSVEYRGSWKPVVKCSIPDQTALPAKPLDNTAGRKPARHHVVLNTHS